MSTSIGRSTFGQPKKPSQPRSADQEKALLDLKEQRDQCQKRLLAIEEQEAELKNLARQFMQEGNKQKAVNCLKKSNIQAVNYAKVANILNRVEGMIAYL